MYILEGNIGAGKSTFLKLIEQHLPHVGIAYEPLQNWQSQVYGQSLLTNFYQNPQRWAYTMETLTMICRVKEHLAEQNNGNTNRVVERSIYSGHYCFAKNGYEQGFMSDVEWRVYNEWFNFLIPQKCLPPSGFIYLKVAPNVTYERIKKRNRLAEKKITLKYLKQIDQCHEDFLVNKIGVLPELAVTPVLTLDCNEEFETDAAKLNEHLAKVQEFMAQTQLLKKESKVHVLAT